MGLMQDHVHYMLTCVIEDCLQPRCVCCRAEMPEVARVSPACHAESGWVEENRHFWFEASFTSSFSPHGTSDSTRRLYVHIPGAPCVLGVGFAVLPEMMKSEWGRPLAISRYWDMKRHRPRSSSSTEHEVVHQIIKLLISSVGQPIGRRAKQLGLFRRNPERHLPDHRIRSITDQHQLLRQAIDPVTGHSRESYQRSVSRWDPEPCWPILLLAI